MLLEARLRDQSLMYQPGFKFLISRRSDKAFQELSFKKIPEKVFHC